ncbi:MAG: anion permease [Thaumarchaeota archaeon]|nr:anion permease [Nitrososphaerota archaeon]
MNGSETRYILAAVGVLALILGGLELVPGLTPQGNRALALTIFAATWWVAELLPGPLTSLLIPILGIVYIGIDTPTALGGFTVPPVWFFLGASMMMTAVMETGLGERIGTRISTSIRITQVRTLVAMSFLLGVLFSPVLPSLVGKYFVLLPIYIGLLKKLGVEPKSKEAVWAMMSLAIGLRTSSIMVLNGDTLNIVVAGLLGLQRGQPVSWSEYLVTFGAPAIAWTLFSFGLIAVLSPRTRFREQTPTQAEKPPPLTSKERRVLYLLIGGILLWALDFTHGIDPAWIALFLGIISFAPRIGVLDAKHLAKVDYGLFLYAGGAISLASILISSGLAASLSKSLQSIAGDLDLFTGFFLFSIMTSIVHLGMTGIATASTVQPISMQFFSSTGANPVLGAAATLAGNGWFIFPYQLIPTLVIYRAGWVSMRDWIKVAAIWSLPSLVVLPLFYYAWLV